MENKNNISLLQEVEQLTQELQNQNIVISDSYEDWLKIAFALSHDLGEQGRTFFHQISSMSVKYDPSICDRKYTHCLQSRRDGIAIGTLFQMAKDAGVNLSQLYAKTHSCQNADMPIRQEHPKTPQNTTFDTLGILGTLSPLALSTPTDHFSQQLSQDDLPAILHPVLQNHGSTVEATDMMLLGTLNIISGLLPQSYYAIYDRRKVHASLYNIIYGGFASGKGILEFCKQIATPIKQEMRQAYDAQLSQYQQELQAWEATDKRSRGPEPQAPQMANPIISANSSASAFYRGMDANHGWGIMFETEADTLTNMLSKSEYGDYSDLLRKAHHHETISMVRVSDRINIEIPHPRLSSLISCTPSQLPLLLPSANIANGLASRFLFYALPEGKTEFRDVFAGKDSPLDNIYLQIGHQFLPLYHELLLREQRPIQFTLSAQQQDTFLSTFREILEEQFTMLGDGIQGFIYRLALECFRYCMILTILRRLSDWDGNGTIFLPEEQALPCNNTDFNTAVAIIKCLVNHTARIFAVLCNIGEDPFLKAQGTISKSLLTFYKKLPHDGTFTTAQALETGKTLNLSHRTVMRNLGNLISKHKLLERLSQGVYRKTSLNENPSNN